MRILKFGQAKDPDKFLEYNYPATRDMCKQFLVLITVVLGFSINFAKDIVGMENPTAALKILLILAFCFLFVSIILCGLGLVFIMLAAGDAVYSKVNFGNYAIRSYKIIVFAGLSFILAILNLIFIAIATLF